MLESNVACIFSSLLAQERMGMHACKDFRVWDSLVNPLHNTTKSRPGFFRMNCTHHTPQNVRIHGAQPKKKKKSSWCAGEPSALTDNEQKSMRQSSLWVHWAIIAAESSKIGGHALKAIRLSFSLFLPFVLLYSLVKVMLLNHHWDINYIH